MKKLLLAAAAVVAMNMSHGAIAQTGSNAKDDIAVLISQIQADRRAIVLQNMNLTAEETTAFVPIYDEYQAEQKAIAKERVDIIDKFAKHYNMTSGTEQMDSQKSAEILKSWMKLEDRDLALTKRYIKRYEKVLNSTQVLRLVQIENKIDALMAVEMAQMIPLAQ
jgi:hypothetical protein